MANHTDGPWHSGTDPRQIEAGDGTIICTVSGALSGESVLADARLIAAAPELLEALRRADQFITNGIALGYIRMPDADCPDPAHETPSVVRAAIAKATGGEA